MPTVASNCALVSPAFTALPTPVAIDGAAACAVYDRRLVLVRPDGHIAWRGDALPDADALVARVTGADG
jgi:hypothetical protein